MEITMEEKPVEENPNGECGGVSSDRIRKRKRKLTWTMKMTMKRRRRRKKHNNHCRNSIPGDFLCAEEFGKKFLVCAADPDYIGEVQGKEVSIEEYLRNKSVGLLFAQIDSYKDLFFLRALKDIYDQLWKVFEIVFVPFFPMNKKKMKKLDADAAMDIYEHNRDLFYSHLMRMPWPAVKFEELYWRKHLVKKYAICSNKTVELLLFDPQGRPLRQDMDTFTYLVHTYGADFYPFTDARLLELNNQYLASLRSSKPSFQALLGSGNRDYLISFAAADDDDDDGKIKKVPISQLQGKVVGICFSSGLGGKKQNLNFFKKLEDFRICAGGNFEIVFVNVDFYSGYKSETSFHNFLKKWPWLLALPFKDEKIRALSFVLSSDPVSPLVIVGDPGDTFFVDPFGYDVLEEYGFDAYPFTRDMAVKIEKTRLTTQLKLADFFTTTTESLMYYGVGEEPKSMPVSFLTNKKVLLYLAHNSFCDDCRRHIRKFHDLQIKDPSFHVIIHIPLSSAHNSAIIPNDWNCLAFPENADWIDDIFKFEIPCCHFIAFDDTGKLVKMGSMDSFLINVDDAAFPFATDETFDKALRDILISTNEWYTEAGKNLLT